MAREAALTKHVFLEYSEYQRFMELKRRNEELVEKNRDLENEIKMLRKQGGGIQDILEKEQKEKLKAPLVGEIASITLPPSVQTAIATAPDLMETKWYFLGKPSKNAGK